MPKADGFPSGNACAKISGANSLLMFFVLLIFAGPEFLPVNSRHRDMP